MTVKGSGGLKGRFESRLIGGGSLGWSIRSSPYYQFGTFKKRKKKKVKRLKKTAGIVVLGRNGGQSKRANLSSSLVGKGDWERRTRASNLVNGHGGTSRAGDFNVRESPCK